VKLDVLPFDRTTMNPLADARTVAQLVRRLRAHRPDVFFGYTIKPVIYGSIAARIARVPRRYAMVSGVGYTFLGGGDLRRRALTQLIKRLYRVALAGCTGVFFQNRDDLAEFEQIGLLPPHLQRFVVHGSGVDLAEFTPQPLPTGAPIVLYMGRLLRDKGIIELIDAARLVRRRRPDVRFQLLGHLDKNPAAVTQDELDAWVREGVVEYLGETDDVRPYLAAATMLALPSYREGTPRSVLEALATGRPIVATDVPGCRETVVHGENGYLVPPFEAAPLADAIVRTLADPAELERMARASRALAESKYDARRVSAAMLEAMQLAAP